MSVPTDSTAPVPISVSDPTVVAGETSVIRLGKRVRDWIAALSPSGADKYDTGWMAVALASGVTGSCSARRVGRLVEVRWACSTALAAGASLTVVAAGGIPEALRPSPQNRAASVWGQGTYSLVGLVLTAGSISVRNVHSASISDHAGSAVYIVD